MQKFFFCSILFVSSIYTDHLNSSNLTNFQEDISIERICQAARDNNITLLQELINSGIDLNVKNRSGFSPLSYACAEGNYRGASLLLSNGASPNGENRLGFAAQENSVDLINILFLFGADLEEMDEHGYTPLLQAIFFNQIEAVKLLIEKGANIEVEHVIWQSPLIMACLKEHSEIVQFLLESGAKINKPSNEGVFPLYYASLNKNREIEALLFQFGAKESQRQTSLHKIPLIFTNIFPYPSISSEELPVCSLYAKIDGQMFPFDLDTGCDFYMLVREKALNKINLKTEIDPTSFEDVSGNIYEVPGYQIDRVDLGSFGLLNVPVFEEPKEFYAEGCILNDSFLKSLTKFHYIKSSGLIGLPFLKHNEYCLMDFPNALLYLGSADDLADFCNITEQSLKEYLQIPLETNYEGLVIKLLTEYGEKTFLIDTGFTSSQIHKLHSRCNPDDIYNITLHSFAKEKLGNIELLIADLPLLDNSEIDGTIGLDFLKDRPILLDFKNQYIYFGQKSNTHTWKYRKSRK